MATDIKSDKLQENLAPPKQLSNIERIKLKLKLSEEVQAPTRRTYTSGEVRRQPGRQPARRDGTGCPKSTKE